MTDDVIDTIRQTFYLRSEEIRPSTPLQEFVRDSIDAIELIAVLSSRYSIRVEPADLAAIWDVADIITYVERAHAPDSQVPLESF
jgi:acyl carrier protein